VVKGHKDLELFEELESFYGTIVLMHKLRTGFWRMPNVGVWPNVD
jgi:hypothetical protein